MKNTVCLCLGLLLCLYSFCIGATNQCQKDQELLASVGLPTVVDCKKSGVVPYRVIKDSMRGCAKTYMANIPLDNGDKIPLYNPDCLSSVRGQWLNQNVQASFKNAWSNIP